MTRLNQIVCFSQVKIIDNSTRTVPIGTKFGGKLVLGQPKKSAKNSSRRSRAARDINVPSLASSDIYKSM